MASGPRPPRPSLSPPRSPAASPHAASVCQGVFCVRVSEWSAALWADVWAKAARRFYWGGYWEQNALARQLAARHEGIEAVNPFHSYQEGGPAGVKLFRHVAVLPRHAFNTNRADVSTRGARLAASAIGAVRAAAMASGAAAGTAVGEGEATSIGCEETADDRSVRCDFIFHAAGHPVLRRDRAPGSCTFHSTTELWRPTPVPGATSKVLALECMLAHAGLLTSAAQHRAAANAAESESIRGAPEANNL